MKQRDPIKELTKIFDELKNGDNSLDILLTKIFSEYHNGLYHILFLHRLNIKGIYLKKLYEECCKSNYYLFLLTLNMIEKATFSITEIFNNLNLDKPIPFISDINDKVLKPAFYNKLDKHKEYCDEQHIKFQNELTSILNDKQTNKII